MSVGESLKTSNSAVFEGTAQGGDGNEISGLSRVLPVRLDIHESPPVSERPFKVGQQCICDFPLLSFARVVEIVLPVMIERQNLDQKHEKDRRFTRNI